MNFGTPHQNTIMDLNQISKSQHNQFALNKQYPAYAQHDQQDDQPAKIQQNVQNSNMNDKFSPIIGKMNSGNKKVILIGKANSNKMPLSSKLKLSASILKPVNRLVKLNPTTANAQNLVNLQNAPQQEQQKQLNIQRPVTPEEIRKRCLDCPSMKDFIHSLQGEVKRLQNLTNELNMQMIMEGITPTKEMNDSVVPSSTSTTAQHKPKTIDSLTQMKIICPHCPARKAAQDKLQMQANVYQLSSSNGMQQQQPQQNSRPDSAFRLRQVLGIKDKKRQVFEQEQMQFVEQVRNNHQQRKDNCNMMDYKPLHQSANMIRVSSSKLARRTTKKVNIVSKLPPLKQDEQYQ